MHDNTLLDVRRRRHDDLAAAYLVSVRNAKTRATYTEGLKQYLWFCEEMGFDPLTVGRPQIELWLHHLDRLGRKPATIVNRLTPVRRFYAYLLDEGEIDRDPAARVPRPKQPRITTTGYLRGSQLLDLVAASKVLGVHAHALVCILVFNGLRISEATGADVGAFTYRENYPVLTVRRKGGNIGWVELGRATEHAVIAAIGDRADGPLLLNQRGRRIDQQAAQRILDRCARAVRGNPPHIHPHMIRHSWCTEAIRAGVPRDQLVRDGGWVDGRMADSIYAHAGELPGRGAAHRLEATVLSG